VGAEINLNKGCTITIELQQQQQQQRSTGTQSRIKSSAKEAETMVDFLPNKPDGAKHGEKKQILQRCFYY
jgi:hypothetical protein